MRCISVKHMYMHYCICVQYSLYTGRKVEFPDVAYSGNVYGTSGNAKESAQYRAEFPGNSALFCMFPAAGNFIFALWYIGILVTDGREQTATNQSAYRMMTMGCVWCRLDEGRAGDQNRLWS